MIAQHHAPSPWPPAPSVELKNRVEAGLTLKMPVVVLLKGPSLATLTTELLEQVGMTPPGETTPPIPRPEGRP